MRTLLFRFLVFHHGGIPHKASLVYPLHACLDLNHATHVYMAAQVPQIPAGPIDFSGGVGMNCLSPLLRSSYMVGAGTLVVDTAEQESVVVQVPQPAVGTCQATYGNHRWT